MPSGPILVIRLSAIGDVALSVPVVAAMAEDYELLVLTGFPQSEFFRNIKGVSVFTPSLKGRHRGLPGIYRLYRDIRKEYSVSGVVDLHDVIRSRLLSFLFRLSGEKISRIRKERRQKRKFLKKPGQEWLKHTCVRYQETFTRVLDIKPDYSGKSFVFSDSEVEEARAFMARNEEAEVNLRVGVAPFAKHKTKEWPFENMLALIELINKAGKASIYLFGTKSEFNSVPPFKLPVNATIVTGSLGIRSELALIKQLDIMISMDSANMHLAAIAGIPTLSVWGGTHPGFGFSPPGGQGHLRAEIPVAELDCRPCTVYGKGSCKRKDNKYKCLGDLSPAYLMSVLRDSGFIYS